MKAPTQAKIVAACEKIGKPLRLKGSEYVGPCPICGGDDRFHVGQKADGSALFGCRLCDEHMASKDSFFQVVLQTLGLWQKPQKSKGRRDGGVEEARYEVRTVDGVLRGIHIVIRKPDGSKDVPWDRKVGNPGKMPLYRSQYLKDVGPDIVFVTEGEKAADALARTIADDPVAARGVVLVVGTVTGASGVPGKTALQPLVDRLVGGGSDPDGTIYLWPDADSNGKGQQHMQRVGGGMLSLSVNGRKLDPRSIRIIDWPNAPDTGDAADWVDAGKVPSLADLMRDAAYFEPTKPGRPRADGKAKPTNPEDLKRPERTKGLPTIVIESGRATEYEREAIKALDAAGLRNDAASVYTTPVTAAATGKPTGGITILNSQAKADTTPLPDAAAIKRDRFVRWPDDELVIGAVEPDVMQAMLKTSAWWLRMGEMGLVETDPSIAIAKATMARYKLDCRFTQYPRFRTLLGITDAPAMRRDGTVIDTPGYDPQSRLYAAFDKNWPPSKPDPTREDAQRSLQELEEVVSESPFAGLEHRAVWVASVLTIVGREMCGNVPLFLVTANHRGSGKGTLVDMATAIATGRAAAKWTPSDSDRPGDRNAEDDKRLTTVALNGTRVLCLDNVPAGQSIGTPALDRALTSGSDETVGELSGRLLGYNVEAKAPWRVVVFATGNNIVVRGDLDRRVLQCRLHTNETEPETHDYKRDSPIEYCIKHRERLLNAALTIMVAHRRALDAGETEPLPKWNSYNAWSRNIRSAIVWAGGEDPFRTVYEVKENAHPEDKAAEAFLTAWFTAFGDAETCTSDIEMVCRDSAQPRDDYQELAETVKELNLKPPKGAMSVNTISLGAWLRARKNRPGKIVVREGKEKARSWYVEPGDTPTTTDHAQESTGGKMPLCYACKETPVSRRSARLCDECEAAQPKPLDPATQNVTQ